MQASRYPLKRWYRAGARGLVLTWDDQSQTRIAGRQVFLLKRTPVRIQGRLFRTTHSSQLEYEAPAFGPQR